LITRATPRLSCLSNKKGLESTKALASVYEGMHPGTNARLLEIYIMDEVVKGFLRRPETLKI
jgi:hypothetical protein